MKVLISNPSAWLILEKVKRRLLIGCIFLSCFMTTAQNLQVFDVPNALKYSAHNDDYTVAVRTPGGVWTDLFEYDIEVDLDTKSRASMVHFSFTGKVEVMVKKNNGRFQEVAIRPATLGIVPVRATSTVYFTLDKPSNISVEFDGDRLHNLHVFAGQLETAVPDPKDPDVIYFGPGIHQPGDQPGDVYHITSNKTVYLVGGAVVKAKFLIDHAENVTIKGHGIIWQPERGIEIRHSSNVNIDGVTIINPNHYSIYGGQTTGLNIKGIKSVSSRGWSDGIDLMSCSDVIIDGVFMRNSDDCIAIYSHRWDFYGDAKNYQIKNSTLWADVAHPVNIGLHGDASGAGEVIENLNFSNIDILEHDEDDRNYQGCLAISAGDNNTVRNITFRNIRIDDIQEGSLFNFRVYFNDKYSAAAGRAIKNVVLSNIQYNGRPVNPFLIQGYDIGREVDEVTIKDLTVNGFKILSAINDYGTIGKYSNNIKFIK